MMPILGGWVKDLFYSKYQADKVYLANVHLPASQLTNNVESPTNNIFTG
jgi:hypothetical protein